MSVVDIVQQLPQIEALCQKLYLTQVRVCTLADGSVGKMLFSSRFPCIILVGNMERTCA